MVSRDAVVGLVGAVVILTALVSVVAVEARNGPFWRDLAPATFSGTATGTYHASAGAGTPLPGGVCVPPPGETTCRGPETSVDLRLDGLPPLGPGLHYAAFLTAEGQPAHPLGALTVDGPAYSLQRTEARDGQSDAQLLVTLEGDAATAAPSGPVAYRAAVGSGADGGPVALAGPFTGTWADATGTLRLSQIGLVSVSAIAVVALEGVDPPPPGAAYRAWYQKGEGDGAVFAFVDDLRFDPGGPRATLDKRVERVRLADQDRFIVTVEAAASDPSTAPWGPYMFWAAI